MLERLSSEVTRILRESEWARWLVESQGISPPTVFTPAEFAEVQRRDVARWAEIVRRSGATMGRATPPAPRRLPCARGG